VKGMLFLQVATRITPHSVSLTMDSNAKLNSCLSFFLCFMRLDCIVGFVGGVAQWLGRWSLGGGLSLIYS